MGMRGSKKNKIRNHATRIKRHNSTSTSRLSAPPGQGRVCSYLAAGRVQYGGGAVVLVALGAGIAVRARAVDDPVGIKARRGNHGHGYRRHKGEEEAGLAEHGSLDVCVCL